MATASLSWARRRTSVWGLAAIVAALLTGLMVYSYLSWLRSQIPVAGPLVPVVVARQDLAPGTLISDAHVELDDHPERYLPAAAIGELGDVIGKAASIPIFAGEIITSPKLGQTGGLSSLVPDGHRAYSLAVESGAHLGFVPRQGDKVDVLATFPREVIGEPKTVTILRSKEVAAYGDSATAEDDRLGLDVSAGITLTLFVTPDEAEALAMAESLGRITVVLAPSQEEDSATDGITPSELISR